MEPMRVVGERNVFRLEGDYWTIVFERKTVRLRSSKGLHYLAVLLRRPGEDVHVVDVEAAALPVTVDPAPPNVRSAEHARIAVTKGIKAALVRITAAHPELGAHLSATVRRGYRCRYLPDPRRPIRWEE
jgi:hypothetical protein